MKTTARLRRDSGRLSVLQQIKRSRESYLLLAPFMLLFLLLTVIPMVSAIGLSFTNFNMLEAPRFVGWQNYQRMLLGDPTFYKVVGNTLVFAFLTGPISYVLSFLFVWAFLLSSDSYGVINGLLLQMNIIQEPIGWLVDQNWMMGSLIVVQLWMSLGTGFLAFIAGFQSMDKSLFEAGAIDGVRNRWQELWYITIPSMSSQLLFSAVMQIGASFGVSTVITTLVGFPTSQYSADTIVTYIMDIGTTRFEMGYACTIAVFLFALMFLTNFVISSALRRFSPD